MRSFALLVVAVTLLRGSVIHAASYTETDGTVVDPILDTSGGTHLYSGNDLEPSANLSNANLTDASLVYAILTDATLTIINAFLAHSDPDPGLSFLPVWPEEKEAC
jgi:hypothetical protein